MQTRLPIEPPAPAFASRRNCALTGRGIRRFRTSTARSGYTILEICLALFIVAMIVGAIIPFTGGFMTEQQLREPTRQIELLARTARHLATLQQRPYVLVLNKDHILLQPYNPADPTAPFQAPDTDSPSSHGPLTSQSTSLTTTTHAAPVQNNTASSSDTPIYSLQDPVEQEYSLPDSVTFTVRGWQEKDWYAPQDRTWIFPPTGLCEPLEVRIQKGDAYIENSYDPLTASVKSERFLIP